MQFFRPEHYAAFIPPKPDLDDEQTQAERLHVRGALLSLGDQLWPHIEQKGWDLHRHRQKDHYTSSFHFVPADDGGWIVDHIGSMWLHYGKSPDQLDRWKTLGVYDSADRRSRDDFFNAFYLHTRIQVYINAHCVRAWLLFTDKNYYDRAEFLKRIRKDPTFRSQLEAAIETLMGKDFFYEIDNSMYMLDPQIRGVTIADVIDFIKQDRGGVYSGFVKEYQPEDPRISQDNIVGEMQRNLDLLYPLYELMAWRG